MHLVVIAKLTTVGSTKFCRKRFTLPEVVLFHVSTQCFAHIFRGLGCEFVVTLEQMEIRC